MTQSLPSCGQLSELPPVSAVVTVTQPRASTWKQSENVVSHWPLPPHVACTSPVVYQPLGQLSEAVVDTGYSPGEIGCLEN